MKTDSRMGHFPATIKPKNEAEQCSTANPYPPSRRVLGRFAPSTHRKSEDTIPVISETSIVPIFRLLIMANSPQLEVKPDSTAH
jgi:hypothetical protein